MNRLMRYLSFSLLLILGMVPIASGASVTIVEGSLTLPTYPWGPDDINPKFDFLENSIIYPYTMQDHLSTQKVNREYKAFFLENEYLKITCLPELGGRIYSVLDKTTGQEMFHTNPVIKPGLIAMRGAWISGGIEWNTGPHGHTVTAVTPVNVIAQKENGGAASLIISNTEQIFRTRWTVTVTLHPGRAYLDEHISIANPTDGVHPFYFWNCTAFVCTSGTRFIYPMTLGTDHSGTHFFNWPVDHGKDLSWLKNYDRPSSVFAYHCVFDFFGAYDAGLDRGIVQYANHNQLIGKKAWTWGQSEDGIISERNLHDFNEQYIEVQSGPLLTQADYGLLHPREEVAWQEWWYPIHSMGDGFEYATRDVAIQRHATEKQVEFRIQTTAEFRSAQCNFTQNGATLAGKTLNLSPLNPAVITLTCDSTSPITVSITDRKEAILAQYTSPLEIPKVEPPQPDWMNTKKEDQFTVEEFYLKGLLADKQTECREARRWYDLALTRDPQHTPSLIALAVLDLESGLFEDAISSLNKVLDREPDNGTAAFYVGSAYFHHGQYDQALVWGYKAVRSLTQEAVGYDLVGRTYMHMKQYPEAVQAFRKSVEHNAADRRAWLHLLVALYASGERQESQQLCKDLQDADPTDIVPIAVDAFLKKDKTLKIAAKIAPFLGETDFEALEATLIFAECGLPDEAEQLLEDFTLNSKQTNPIPWYYLSFFSHELGKTDLAAQFLATAFSLSPDYVFPSRVETIPVLQSALESTQADSKSLAKTHLYLGNLFGGLGRMNEAQSHWETAAKLDSTLSVAWRNLGLFAWKQDHDLFTAQKDYRSAIDARPNDQTLYRDLAQILLENQERQEAIVLLESMKNRNDLRTDIIEILAQAYVDNRDYDHAISLLENSFFSNWENRTVSHNVFVRAHIERGKQHIKQGEIEAALRDFSTALTYPAYLGVGRPADPEEAEAFYWKGKALEALGKKEDSRAAWSEGAQAPRGSVTQNQYREACRKALEN